MAEQHQNGQDVEGGAPYVGESGYDHLVHVKGFHRTVGNEGGELGGVVSHAQGVLVQVVDQEHQEDVYKRQILPSKSYSVLSWVVIAPVS